MGGKKNLVELVKSMNPKLNDGVYVFATIKDFGLIRREDTICEFKEKEGITIVIEKSRADALNLKYDFVAAWITLMGHSSLELYK
jgi:uncharacterized protein